MTTVSEFVANYQEDDHQRISFAWNGKHPSEFADENQAFRWEVVQYCIDHPDKVPIPLLRHLLLADAAWSRQAWCAPNHFARLATVFLLRGRRTSPEPFAHAFLTSFDTFGACHEISLPADVLDELIDETAELINAATASECLERLTSVKELLDRIKQGDATKGWALVPGGTPVRNIRVVWPAWHVRAWKRIGAWLAGLPGR